MLPHPRSMPCSVADFFRMPALRMEALCVVCQKAEASHLPVLHDLVDRHNVEGLTACIKALIGQQKRPWYHSAAALQ